MIDSVFGFHLAWSIKTHQMSWFALSLAENFEILTNRKAVDVNRSAQCQQNLYYANCQSCDQKQFAVSQSAT